MAMTDEGPIFPLVTMFFAFKTLRDKVLVNQDNLDLFEYSAEQAGVLDKGTLQIVGGVVIVPHAIAPTDPRAVIEGGG